MGAVRTRHSALAVLSLRQLLLRRCRATTGKLSAGGPCETRLGAGSGLAEIRLEAKMGAEPACHRSADRVEGDAAAPLHAGYRFRASAGRRPRRQGDVGPAQ
ncbi:hypothetical protein T484DRAFT_1937284 [Baffinella frigidus]|nr:hypothetical protein T484DRAFT_1937284 [Cryptophyta sp. CCMP2293]